MTVYLLEAHDSKCQVEDDWRGADHYVLYGAETTENALIATGMLCHSKVLRDVALFMFGCGTRLEDGDRPTLLCSDDLKNEVERMYMEFMHSAGNATRH